MEQREIDEGIDRRRWRACDSIVWVAILGIMVILGLAWWIG